MPHFQERRILRRSKIGAEYPSDFGHRERNLDTRIFSLRFTPAEELIKLRHRVQSSPVIRGFSTSTRPRYARFSSLYAVFSVFRIYPALEFLELFVNLRDWESSRPLLQMVVSPSTEFSIWRRLDRKKERGENPPLFAVFRNRV